MEEVHGVAGPDLVFFRRCDVGVYLIDDGAGVWPFVLDVREIGGKHDVIGADLARDALVLPVKWMFFHQRAAAVGEMHGVWGAVAVFGRDSVGPTLGRDFEVSVGGDEGVMTGIVLDTPFVVGRSLARRWGNGEVRRHLGRGDTRLLSGEQSDLIEGEQSGPSTPFDLDAFVAHQRGSQPPGS